MFTNFSGDVVSLRLNCSACRREVRIGLAPDAAAPQMVACGRCAMAAAFNTLRGPGAITEAARGQGSGPAPADVLAQAVAEFRSRGGEVNARIADHLATMPLPSPPPPPSGALFALGDIRVSNAAAAVLSRTEPGSLWAMLDRFCQGWLSESNNLRDHKPTDRDRALGRNAPTPVKAALAVEAGVGSIIGSYQVAGKVPTPHNTLTRGGTEGPVALWTLLDGDATRTIVFAPVDNVRPV